MDFVPLVIASAMTWTALSFIKLLRGGKTGDALTLISLVVVGVGVAFLLRASDFAAGVDVGTGTLANLNAASTILFGYAIGSGARAIYEATNNKPTNEPKLFENPGLDG